MAVTKPVVYPAWATTYLGNQQDEVGNEVENRSVPPVAKMTDGLLPDEPMARQWLNHQFYQLDAWVKWFDSNGGTGAYLFQGEATPAEINALDVATMAVNMAWKMTVAGDITIGDNTPLTVAIDDFIVWYADTVTIPEEDRTSGFVNVGAIGGVKGDQGLQGEIGDPPNHEIQDINGYTEIRFEKQPEEEGGAVEWGEWGRLEGEKGDVGTGVTLKGSGTIETILAITDAVVGDLYMTTNSGRLPGDHPTYPDGFVEAGHGLAWVEGEGSIPAHWAYVSFGAITVGFTVKGSANLEDILNNVTAGVGEVWVSLTSGNMPPDHPTQGGKEVLEGHGLVWTESGYWVAFNTGIDFAAGDIEFGASIVLTQPNSLQSRAVGGAMHHLISLDGDTDISVGSYDNGTALANRRLGLFAEDHEIYVVEEYNNPVKQFKILSDKNGVNLAGTQTVTGAKTFSGTTIVPAPTADTHASTKLYVDNEVSGAITDLEAQIATTVKLTGDQTIAGVKTFSSPVPVVTPTADAHATTKAYVDGLVEGIQGDLDGAVLITGDQTVEGLKTFTSPVVVGESTGGSHAVRRSLLEATATALSEYTDEQIAMLNTQLRDFIGTVTGNNTSYDGGVLD